MALVLRIIDEIPRHRSKDQLHGMSFQKDRRLSVSTKVPKNFARTPPPAFLFPDQRFQRPGPEEPAKPFNARSRRRRCLPPLIFRVNQFFLKNFLNTPETRRPRRRRLSNEGRSHCQPGFSAFPQTRNQGSRPTSQNPVAEIRAPPVTERAADIRTPFRLHNPSMTNS